MNARLAILAAALTVAAVGPAAMAQAVKGIVIDTDRSVNTATLKTIVADVCKGCKSDQDIKNGSHPWSDGPTGAASPPC